MDLTDSRTNEYYWHILKARTHSAKFIYPWLSGCRRKGVLSDWNPERCPLWKGRRSSGKTLPLHGCWRRSHDSICCWIIPDVEDGAQTWFHSSLLPSVLQEYKGTHRMICNYKTKLCFGWWQSKGEYWVENIEHLPVWFSIWFLFLGQKEFSHKTLENYRIKRNVSSQAILWALEFTVITFYPPPGLKCELLKGFSCVWWDLNVPTHHFPQKLKALNLETPVICHILWNRPQHRSHWGGDTIDICRLKGVITL